MTQAPSTWLRKQRTLRAGPVELTVTMPVALAERLRTSSAYRRVVRPLLARSESSSSAVSPRPVPVTPPDAEARALLARIGQVDWYHSIDLGHGVVTPGLVDHRAQLPFYGLPSSLAGKRVLDAATFDGFWAFEFERRGAEVVALDPGGWAKVDLPHRMHPYAPEFELDRKNGTAFAIAHEILASQVRRVEGSIYDLDPGRNGTFDLVFASDLLMHLRCPQRAIESLASVCRGEMVIADVFTPMLEGFGELAIAYYSAPGDPWWRPNVKTLTQMMYVAGCESIEEVSRLGPDGSGERAMHKVVLRGQVPADPLWLQESRKWAATVSPKWKSAAEQPA